MQSKVRVVFFGVGSVASAALELCRMRPWIEVAGAVRRPAAEGAAARPPAPVWRGVKVWENPDDMLEQTVPEAAFIATRSALGEVLPDIERCVRRGVHVVGTSEELAWPDLEKPGAARSAAGRVFTRRAEVVITADKPGRIVRSISFSPDMRMRSRTSQPAASGSTCRESSNLSHSRPPIQAEAIWEAPAVSGGRMVYSASSWTCSAGIGSTCSSYRSISSPNLFLHCITGCECRL